MKHPRLLGLILAASLAPNALALGLAPQAAQSRDSDGLHITRWGASALPLWRDATHWRGVAYETQQYQQLDREVKTRSLAWVDQQVNAQTALGYTLRLGWSEGAQRNLWTGDWSWSAAASERLQWNVFANRDRVESLPALQQGVHMNLVGVGADYQFHPRLTGVVAAHHTAFSDDQQRDVQRWRLIWDAWPEQGVNLQWALRTQRGQRNGQPPLYFNPNRFEDSLVYLGWRRRYAGWLVQGRAGLGEQRIDAQERTPARASELLVQSPQRDGQSLRLQWSSMQSAGGLQGAGYRWQQLQAQWVIQLR
ncbi:MAG: hypothetical protein FGM28_11250 [Limnohabitans sp.]|jgi:hypothetical protein|nr:hypothetical protein [Limnohabitans sp.]